VGKCSEITTASPTHPDQDGIDLSKEKISHERKNLYLRSEGVNHKILWLSRAWAYQNEMFLPVHFSRQERGERDREKWKPLCVENIFLHRAGCSFSSVRGW
jgi:hypothetical protein